MSAVTRLVAIGLLLALAGCTEPAPDGTPVTPPVTIDLPAGFAAWWDGSGPDDAAGAPGQAPNNLVGPHYGVRASVLQVAQQVSVDAAVRATLRQPAGASPLPQPATVPATLRAVPGQEIVLAWLPGEQGLDGRVAAGLSTVDSILTIGGKTINLGRLPVETGLMVSAPTGAGVRLTTGDPGRLQSLDLRTGKRLTGPPAFYADFPSYLGGTSSGSGGFARLRAGGRLYSATLFQWEAVRKPWADGFGYAPKGRAWLTVDVTFATQREGTDGGELSLVLNPGRAFRVGRLSPVKGSVKRTIDEEAASGTDSYRFVVAVGDDFTGDTLRISLAGGEISVDGKAGPFSVVESKGLVTPFALG